eukprot:UN29484
MTSESPAVDQALVCKTEGNKHFKEKSYQKAVDCYTKAIELHNSDDTSAANLKKLGIYYNNRASAHFHLENYGSAENDATVAIECNFVKGYYRRGQSRIALDKMKEALSDFKNAKKYFPKKQDIINALKNTQKIIKERKFLAAIKNDSQLPSDIMKNLIENPLPAKYKGPKVECDENHQLKLSRDKVVD